MKSTQRIGLLLGIVFLLPALFFSVYQVSRLDDDERMIQEIYQKQLDAILFSVNQYSDDIIGSWVSRVETGLDVSVSEDSIPGKIYDLFLLNSALKGVFVIDSTSQKISMNTFSTDIVKQDSVWKLINESLIRSQIKISQLESFRRSGFLKLEKLAFVYPGHSTLHCLVFSNQYGQDKFRIAGLLIDSEEFIENIVGPRLQAIARDQFILRALDKKNNSTVYSTFTTNVDTSTTSVAVTKDFWIFPEYTLGIGTLGTTLQQIVKDRTRANLILLLSLDAIFVIGIILVFRNLKREVDLAQNKADFVSNVSHEIRTPLALISMFAETLEMNRVPSEEKKQEYYRIISKETNRLSGIVNKILNFSQAEAKKKQLHLEVLNLNDEIKSILSTYDFHLGNKGFAYSFVQQSDVWVMADREAVTESVINLIDNAIKYSEHIKRIEISTGVKEKFGFVSVKDFGVGINKKEQKYIFDKFYRVPTGNLARTRGTGLGLSLVKQLMEEQKGKITVTSEPGQGSEFRLYFNLEDKQS